MHGVVLVWLNVLPRRLSLMNPVELSVDEIPTAEADALCDPVFSSFLRQLVSQKYGDYSKELTW